MWSSLLETWTLTLTSHTLQALILVEWPLHQECAVVMKIRFKQSLLRESFGWILLNLEFICVIGTVLTYLEKWGERVPKFNKSMREKEKRWERENAWISVMWLPKFLLPDQPAQVCVCVCSKCEVLKLEIQLWQCHCRNRGRKKNLWQLWQSHCRKWEEEKKVVAEIWGGIKKKVLRSQYFYNIFTINHKWLVISSNLNLTLRLLF